MPWSRDTARSYRELGPQRHLDVVRQLLPEMLGALGGRRVLDFGCGPGHLAIALAAAGAAEVVAVDESREMVAAASEALAAAGTPVGDRVALRLGDESSLREAGRFDAALCSLALMMCATRPRLESTCRALVECLRPGGRLLAVVTHPCFRSAGYPTFRYRLPEGFRYWSSGASYDVVLTPPDDDRKTTITDYHWTVEDYVNAFAEAGAGITRCREMPALWDERDGPVGPPAYLALRVERGGDTVPTADA